jgi:hypothetical protein
MGRRGSGGRPGAFPLRASRGARALGRGLSSLGPILGRRRFIGLPAAYRVFARDALLFPYLGFASRCVGPDRRRLASVPGQRALRVPAIGAPPGELATVADGLLSSRAAPVAFATAPQDSRRSPLLRFVSPSAYASRAVLVRDCRPPDYPAATLTRFHRQLHPQSWPMCVSSLRFSFAPSRQSFPFRDDGLVRRNVSGVAPRVIRARVLPILSGRACSVTDPPPGIVAAWPTSSSDVLHSTSCKATVGNAPGVPC